jgi:hypothetical protein
MNTLELKEKMVSIQGSLVAIRQQNLGDQFIERFTREALDNAYIISADCDRVINSQPVTLPVIEPLNTVLRSLTP